MKLKNFFSSKNFFIKENTANIIEALLSNPPVAIMLRGRAGVGKTAMTKLIAEYLNAEYLFFQCFPGSTEDDLIFKILPCEKTASGLKITEGILAEALRLSHKKKVVVTIDEFDKTRPSADAFLLDFLQNYRISLRNGNEKIIQGNAKNIIVFLTSNDEREFSEPLLRRVITIDLPTLPASEIKKILSKEFNEETVLLLTQIYLDTINAQLTKIATIQELRTLGKLIEEHEGIDFSEAVRSIIIKNEEDWTKYTEYIKYRDVKYEEFEETEDIVEHYEKIDIDIKEEETKERQPRMPIVRRRDKEVKGIKVDDEKTVSALIDDNDFSTYTTLAKNYEATDDANKISDYTVINSDGKRMIIKEHPLRVRDFFEFNNDMKSLLKKGEWYFEDEVNVNVKKFMKKWINEATKIKYYTKTKIAVETKSTIAVIEKTSKSKVKIYGNLKEGEDIDLYLFMPCDYKIVCTDKVTDKLSFSKILETLRDREFVDFKNTRGGWSVKIDYDYHKNKYKLQLGYKLYDKIKEKYSEVSRETAIKYIQEIIDGREQW